MTAKVNVLTASHADVVAVPIQAVVKRRLGDDGRELDEEKDKAAYAAADEHDVVYVFADGKAKVTRVELGTADELRVEIKTGIAEGTEVIVGPYRTLKDLHDGTAVQGEAPAASPAASGSPAGV